MKLFNTKKKETICIQGLGFVGAAMSIIVASAIKRNKPVFNVYGLELNNKKSKEKIKKLNLGKFITNVTDPKLIKNIKLVKKNKNFYATSNKKVIKKSDIIICNVNLDIIKKKNFDCNFKTLEKAIILISKNISEDSLLIIESTVPPGTCEKFILPLIKKEFVKRKIDPSKILLAHSFERVMPGENYFDSIKNYWRVYSANNDRAAEKCKNFYKKIVNVKKYKLTRLKSIRESEFCKILENTYRAVNIAFIDEWSRFAENINVNMFDVINAIKLRPTHSNIMRPGFGVGGYCLTKDPLFGFVSASKLFKKHKINFPITHLASVINENMPSSSVNILENQLKSLKNKKIAIFGVTYRENIGDCRYSPSAYFARILEKKGAEVFAYDPMVKIWNEYKNLNVSVIPNLKKMDALVLAVRHRSFAKLNFNTLLKFNTKMIVLDTFNILTDKQIKEIKSKNCKIIFIGKGTQL
jgi:UDP-N-acetyl-D-glucosamine dehydrogenase